MPARRHRPSPAPVRRPRAGGRFPDRSIDPAWVRVDRYLGRVLGGEPRTFQAARVASYSAGLPEISVSAVQGRWLHLLVRLVRARRVLEIGTLGGYSALWMASALPRGGRLVSLELDPHHAEIARRNIRRAGLARRIEVRVGDALVSLDALSRAGTPPFDLVFVDADKTQYAQYLEGAIRLGRPGTLIVADNVVRQGAIARARHPDPRVVAVRSFLHGLGRDHRVIPAVLPTVGEKGFDGFAFAVVK